MRKLLSAVLASALFAAATPALAQLAGTWAGAGEGWSPFPVNYPSEYMKPWQTWKGFVPNTMDVFSGEWYDGDGNHGTFEGEILFVTPEEAYSEGDWYWIDYRVFPPRYHYMGPFSMKFKLEEAICYGEWQAHLPSGIYPGSMDGEKVD